VIIFPMVGMSRRFREAGYAKPKYMLPLGKHTCFDYSVMGFIKAAQDDTLTFVMRRDFDTPDFVRQRLDALGVTNARLVILDEMTAGQAETVERGIDGITDAGPNGMTIFNIDTFRPGFTFPAQLHQKDGYLETFVGEGDNWSFVEPDGSDQNRVIRTTEKEPISRFCCTGLYQFAQVDAFRWALNEERKNPSKNELYVAPIYNHLIKAGKEIGYTVVPKEDVIFCGVPAEYEALIADGGKKLANIFASN